MITSRKLFTAVLAVLAIGWVIDSLGPSVIGPVSGPRIVTIVHETDDQTPAWRIMEQELRMGENQKYLQDRKHRLDILDDDMKDENLDPDPLVKALVDAAKAKNIEEPFISSADATGRLILLEPLNPTTSTNAMNLIKKSGG